MPTGAAGNAGYHGNAGYAGQADYATGELKPGTMHEAPTGSNGVSPYHNIQGGSFQKMF